ncbi:MAG: hypothetical protein KC910_34780 [Candidatus Eremiobacteraeota bacterium]|nr:hypothetical protein [Candidatus Eremiobacteraeota bacterium]
MQSFLLDPGNEAILQGGSNPDFVPRPPTILTLFLTPFVIVGDDQTYVCL